MKFSIVICNYNYGRFLAAAIDSCLAQDYPADAIEIIVVDDGSTDETPAVLGRYEGQPQLRSIRQPNRGQGAALATGVAAATGDYVCLLDADDTYFPCKLRRLESQIQALEPYGDFFLCHDVRLYDQAALSPTEQSWFEIVHVANAPQQLSLEQCNLQFPFAIPCGQVFSLALAQRLFEGLPTADWRYAVDNPIAHAAFLDTGVVHYLHECLAYYRIHGANDLARIENGRYRPRNDWKPRLPRLIAQLERYVGTLAPDGPERALRLEFLKNRELGLRVTSPLRRLGEPVLSLVLDARTRSIEAVRRTIASVARQTYPMLELVVVCDDETQLRDVDVGSSLPKEFQGEFATHGAALKALGGQFIALLDAGIELEPDFADAQVRHHQYVGLVGVTFCDAEVQDSRTCSAYAELGLRSEQLNAFARPLAALILPSLNTAVVRRSCVFDQLFAAAHATAPSQWRSLLVLFMHAMTGSIFAPGFLVSVPRASHTLLSPSAGSAKDARRNLWVLYCMCARELDRCTTPSWQFEFMQWLVAEAAPQELSQMQATAHARGEEDALAMLLEAAAASRR